MPLKIKKLSKTAKLPVYGSKGAACFDLHADIQQSVEISLFTPGIINTGLAFEIPPGYVMLVFSRSGHGFKNDVRLANGTGIIDSDYRGELLVKLAADQNPFVIHPGDRIAQAMLIPVPHVVFEEVTELSSTDRGTGGFGSTGKN